ncbi:MAG: 3'-5' exonuclease [Candidatus Omnitrophica bacterium]|nr:3'-5' exonuclease [Candidatus Omnitrophota bacterium]
MILFFDTETSGLPRNWKAPISDGNNWPRLVQIAWIVFNEKGERIRTKDYIIKPEGFLIPAEAAKIHGISTEKAINDGKDLSAVLNEFNGEINSSDILVAHNINFDSKIIGAEMIRKEITTNLFSRKLVCTMESTTNFCKIPGLYGNKWPKLSELYMKLFGEDFEEAHNASADIEATAKCFWKLKEINIIK